MYYVNLLVVSTKVRTNQLDISSFLTLFISKMNFIEPFKTFPIALRAIYRQRKTLYQLRAIEKNGGNVGTLFDSYAQKNLNKVCIHFENKEWTYGQIQERSNKIANLFSQEGLKKYDRVAVYMENHPDYISTWLGLSKIGVIPALLNYNLKSSPLKHCLEVAQPKAIICDTQLSDNLHEVLSNSGIKSQVFENTKESTPLNSFTDLKRALSSVSSHQPTEINSINFLDPLLYIYTSGTTGFPKAATIKHARFLLAAIGGANANKITDKDVLYTSLPLYHTAGGILTCSMSVLCGATMVLRNKFSATEFWKDCVAYNVTGAQYMGEICRYLLRQPPCPEETRHSIRVAYGNGLRPEIWDKFVNRFQIPLIWEIYGSTEGNANLYNNANKSGAVGFAHPFLKKLYPFQIIKLDENEEPLRDPKTGLALTCKPGEPGELVSRIEKGHPIRDFSGYADNKSATEKKILRDVEKKGDAFFRTGDLFTKDKSGFFYFKDRLGDTYRWKGENVSTTEIEYIISSLIKYQDVIVFGVKVPHCDGEAGMCVVGDPDGFVLKNLDQLAGQLNETLPHYAIPLFIRIVKEVELTGTHKLTKVNFRKEGYNPKNTKDKIFFYDKTKFIPVDEKLYELISSGLMKL